MHKTISALRGLASPPGWGLAGLCLLLAGLAAPARGQLIDTVEDPALTKNDTINAQMVLTQGLHAGFRLEVVAPELLGSRGVKVRNGFGAWYIYAVECKEVRVAGTALETKGQKLVLALCSRESKIDLADSSALRGRALFLKGFVLAEDMAAKEKEFTAQARKLIAQADSMQALVDSGFMVEPEALAVPKALRAQASQALTAAFAYKELARRGARSPGIAKFFLTHYFARSRNFNLWSHPHGLPEVLPAPEEAVERRLPEKPETRERSKRKRRGKYFR